MKKLLFGVVACGIILISCKKDDNGDQGSNSCQTCEQTISGTLNSTEYCDNGDGTFSTNFQGQSTTQSLGGAPFSAIIVTAENGGATCN
jgi:hypothetical protein